MSPSLSHQIGFAIARVRACCRFPVWRQLAALVGATIGLDPHHACAAENPSRRPNVLFILIDDHAANMTSVFNESPVRTPNIERLAARGSWFSPAYCEVPSCAPSRAAFLTGVHA